MRRTYSSSLNFARSAIVLLSTPEVSLPVFFFIVLYASLIFFSLFTFPFLLPRSQHRHPLPSVWIFFVILEAVFVVFSFSLLNSTCGYPSTAYLFTASQVLCHYSHWNKEWLLPSREGIPIHHITGLQPPPCSQLSTFRYSYHWISLGSSSKPVSGHA